MIPFRGGIRRVLLGILALVSFLAVLYEAIYMSRHHDKLDIRGSSLAKQKTPISFQKKIPLLVRMNNKASNTVDAITSELLMPNVTLGPVILKKLDTIYEQLDVSRTNISRSIFPANQIGGFLMLNRDICTDATIIDVIIIVHTAPNNFKKRREIRATFADRKLFLPREVRVAFLLGKPKDKSIEVDIKLEHAIFKDTVMGDFYDDYHNLTLKGVMGYHWVGEHCANSKVVLKTDDDVMVDMYNLLSRYMPHMEGKQRAIFCNLWVPYMPIRRFGKWRVPRNLFRNQTYFPYSYCSGFVLLFSTDLMTSLYEAAKVTPFFWIDDLYLYGMLPKIAGGITYYDYHVGQNISFYTNKMLECVEKEGLDCSYFATLLHYGGGLTKSWRELELLRNKSKAAKEWNVESFYEP